MLPTNQRPAFTTMAPIPRLPELTSPLGIVLLGLSFCILLYAIDVLFLSLPYPKGVALVRERPGARRFSLKTRWAFYTDSVALQKEAWEKVLYYSPEPICWNFSDNPPLSSISRKETPSSSQHSVTAPSSSCRHRPSGGSTQCRST